MADLCFSPLLDGDGVPSFEPGSKEPAGRKQKRVSVPFSMGTVLLSMLTWRGVLAVFVPAFQSPSRWGRCCIVQTNERVSSRSFSPLLDGDGVASMDCLTQQMAMKGFSPLLDGDGVASDAAIDVTAAY